MYIWEILEIAAKKWWPTPTEGGLSMRWPCEDAQVDQRRTDPRLEQHYMAHTQYTQHNESVEKDLLLPSDVLAAP